MHSCICYLLSTRFSGGLHYLIFPLTVQPFSGLVVEAAPPSVDLPALWRGWLSALGFLVFTRCVFRHLGYLIFLSSRPCPFQTISRGLRYFLKGPFGCFVFLTFSEGGTKWSDELEGSFHATWSWISVPILLAVSLLSPSCLVHPDAIGRRRRSWGILIGPLVPLYKGVWRFWRDCFTIMKRCP